MLEESRMDKKSLNRSSQPQSRASAVDCKKSTDSTFKPWPRNNKKREGPGNAPKNDPNRKNVPAQRGRGQIDKRPHTRGGTNYVVGGAQNTRLDDDDEPEIGSVFVPGSKKQNLNHLLNFMYPTRCTPERGPARRAVQRRPQLQGSLHRLVYDLYLRANCQFVVKEDGDYKANLLDPDVPIKWEQVEEIVVRSTGRSECPICLGAPVAGRVGHCGHVYCWACVLHYAATHDKQPPPCPVCNTALPVKDMKPTKMVQWQSPAEEVTMRLVRRLRGSTTVEIAPPRGQVTKVTEATVLPLDMLNIAPYAKFFAATKLQVLEILNRERQEILDQIMAEIDTSEIEYLEQALVLLKQKEDNITNHYENAKIEVSQTTDSAPTVYEKQEVNVNKIDWFDVTEDVDAQETIDMIQEQVEDLAISLSKSSLNLNTSSFLVDTDNEIEFPLTEDNAVEDAEIDNAEDVNLEDNVFNDADKQNQAKYFYFYQGEDGQQVFLNSLNVRILNASWGALAAAPSIVRGKVLHRETLPLGDQTRKHMPYTAHLPLYCSFDIVELDLQPPYVTPGALAGFSEELDRRARHRARQERDERRRERAYRRTMEGPPKPDFSSELLFPPAPPSFGSPPPLEPQLFSEASSSTSAASGPSFAKMASASGTWRVRKTSSTIPPPPPMDDDAGSLAPRTLSLAPRTLSLSDAIEAALHAAPAPSAAGNGGKKKRSKHKLLFATVQPSA